MLQLGYLHQFDYKITDETGLNFFQIGYFIEFSRKKMTRTLIDMDREDN
jgi:hypothetical protein